MTDLDYVYLHDGSVLGRITGWTTRGGDLVPLIDTTDRNPAGIPVTAPSDLTATRPVGEPDDAVSEAPADQFHRSPGGVAAGASTGDPGPVVMSGGTRPHP